VLACKIRGSKISEFLIVDLPGPPAGARVVAASPTTAEFEIDLPLNSGGVPVFGFTIQHEFQIDEFYIGKYCFPLRPCSCCWSWKFHLIDLLSFSEGRLIRLKFGVIVARFAGDRYYIEYLRAEYTYRFQIRARSEVGLGDPLQVVYTTPKVCKYIVLLTTCNCCCWVWAYISPIVERFPLLCCPSASK
jgi:hypothetical protein